MISLAHHATVELSNGNFVLSDPRIFGAATMVTPSSQVAVCFLRSGLAVIDSTWPPGSRLEKLGGRANALVLFQDPVEVPTVRTRARVGTFLSRGDPTVGSLLARATLDRGHTVDALAVEFDSPGSTGLILQRHGMDQTDTPGTWITSHRTTPAVTPPIEGLAPAVRFQRLLRVHPAARLALILAITLGAAWSALARLHTISRLDGGLSHTTLTIFGIYFGAYVIVLVGLTMWNRMSSATKSTGKMSAAAFAMGALLLPALMAFPNRYGRGYLFSEKYQVFGNLALSVDDSRRHRRSRSLLGRRGTLGNFRVSELRCRT